MSVMSGSVSVAARRTAWLLLGAAIGLAAVLSVASLAAVLGGVLPVPAPALLAVCLVPVALIGLVPGVRGLEVESARTMLGVDDDLVDPQPPRPEHRRRSAAWVVLHLALGLVVAALLFGVLPGAGVTVYSGLSGAALSVGPLEVPAAPGLGRVILLVLLGVAGAVVSVIGSVVIGRLARRWAPAFLGPTPADRLVVAEARLAAESEHTRLARELHDGIGHALTIISLQAAAARRSSGDAIAAEAQLAPLAVIESTAQSALAELDALLGLLRDDAAPRHPEPDLTDLHRLVEVYRGSGMPVAASLAGLDQPPALASRTAYRIVSEGLSNAQRHGAAGQVELRVDGSAGHVRIDLWNPSGPRTAPRSRVGHGLDGVRERVRLFGGVASSTLEPSGRWHLQVSFPCGGPR